MLDFSIFVSQAVLSSSISKRIFFLSKVDPTGGSDTINKMGKHAKVFRGHKRELQPIVLWVKKTEKTQTNLRPRGLTTANKN